MAVVGCETLGQASGLAEAIESERADGAEKFGARRRQREATVAPSRLATDERVRDVRAVFATDVRAGAVARPQIVGRNFFRFTQGDNRKIGVAAEGDGALALLDAEAAGDVAREEGGERGQIVFQRRGTLVHEQLRTVLDATDTTPDFEKVF